MPAPTRDLLVVNTGYVLLSAAYYDDYFSICHTQTGVCDTTPRAGGAIDLLANGYLLVTGGGYLYRFARDAQGVLTASKLPYTVPINETDFAASGESSYGRNHFRVTDVLVEEQAAGRPSTSPITTTTGPRIVWCCGCLR